ncbi:MAG TPA: hypothetical protein PLP23_02875 [Panacibacter sp.]|nr:hypothetical protein [Panacibacter sp.]
MKINLPETVIAGLFKDNLVLVEEKSIPAIPAGQQVTNKKEKQEAAAEPTSKKWYLGDNKKNIVIIIKDPSAVFINDEWLGTLGKLLAACKLNIGDVAIINQLKTNIDFAAMKDQLQPKYVLTFDTLIQDIKLPFTIPHFQIQQYAGTTFMTAPALTLSDAATDAVKMEKRKLWEKLKIIFSV